MVPNAAAHDERSADGVAPGDRVGIGDRYELIERIGAGGMGAVYRARDHKLGCERAVKVLDPKYASIPAFVERFRREAMAASRITHPNIVGVVDVAGEGERPVFLVMELLEGNTISKLIRGKGRLPWSQVKHYIDQIAAGLGAAHAQGVVHRDVKPGNCVVLADDQVKVLDFGIAKVTDMPAEVVALTAAGEIIGTCSYMAPEQIRGQVDKRSDIYALGVLTFRMLTGRVPFSHPDQDKVLLAHLTEAPPAPSSRVSSIPPEVDEFVLNMLAKQPHQRFSSMDELRKVLAKIEFDDGLTVDGATQAPPPGPGKATMFDEARTRFMVRDSTPSPEPMDPGHPTINTAPAGSGSMTEGVLGDDSDYRPAATVAFDGEDGGAAPGTPSSTMLMGEEPPKGGTVVADGVRGLARPVVTPPRSKTEEAPPARKLGVAAGDSAPRVTRIATAEDYEEDGGMVRGVLSAAGGVALAIVVVAGFAWWSQQGDEPSETGAVAEDGSAVVAEPEEDDAAKSDDSAEPEEDDAAAVVPAGDSGGEPAADEAQGDAAVEADETTTGAESQPAAETSDASATNGTKRRKGKKTKAKPVLGAEVELPPPPDPEPDTKTDAPTDKPPRKPGDLRDPF